MPRKAEPKKSMGGDLLRTTISPGKGEAHYPLGRSQEFQSKGYHSKPTGGKAVEPKTSQGDRERREMEEARKRVLASEKARK